MNYLKVSVATTALLTMSTLAFAQNDEGVNRWRFDDNGKEDILILMQASSPATEANGRFAFRCHRHSGKVEVILSLQDHDLSDVAEIIKKDDAPRFAMLPDVEAFEVRIEHNSFDGWVSTFDVDPSSKFLDSFSRSGELSYRLNKTIRKYGIAAGKDVIPSFLKACRKG